MTDLEAPVSVTGSEYFSADETQRRFDLLYEQMDLLDLDAVLLIHLGPGPNRQEEFYFLQSDYIPLSQSATLIPRHGEHTAISTYLQGKSHKRRGTARDVRTFSDNEHPSVTILRTIHDRGITSGRVGWRWDDMPAVWADTLRAGLPGVEWVDIAPAILDIEYQRGDEEVAAATKSAEIADAAYEELLKIVVPGMTEYQIVEELNNITTRLGANRNFTLLGTGPFTRETPMPELAPPSWRTVNEGDYVIMEISPASAGYYTQLARVFQVGGSSVSPYVDELRQVAVDSIAEATAKLRNGVKVSEIANALIDAVAARGYVANLPLGHTVGVDLLYERLTPAIDRVLHTGDTLIVHPKVHHTTGEYAIFWGETYLVTDDGCIGLSKGPKTLRISGTENS